MSLPDLTKLERSLEKAITRRRREVLAQATKVRKKIRLADGREVTAIVTVYPTLHGGTGLVHTGPLTPWGTKASKSKGGRKTAATRKTKRSK